MGSFPIRLHHYTQTGHRAILQSTPQEIDIPFLSMLKKINSPADYELIDRGYDQEFQYINEQPINLSRFSLCHFLESAPPSQLQCFRTFNTCQAILVGIILYINFGLELQAAIASDVSHFLSLSASFHRRLFLISRLLLYCPFRVKLSLLLAFPDGELGIEKGMLKGFTSSDPPLWVFFKQSLQQIKTCIIISVLASGSQRYQQESKLKLQALFQIKIQLYSFPGKGDFLRSNIWKIIPKLNKSHAQVYLVFQSLIFTISGATYPGVPHLTNRYCSALAYSAKPKSAITQSKALSFRSRMFSGLMSRCMIFFLCMASRPYRRLFIISFTSSVFIFLLLAILSERSPPSRSSSTKQIECSVSQTPSSLMIFLWLDFLIVEIYRIKDYLPFSSPQMSYFVKAFTAYLCLSQIRFTRQTVAKFPFPIFLMELYLL